MFPKPVQAVKPNNKNDSGLGTSMGATAPGGSSTKTDHNTPLDATSTADTLLSENDPFLIEVTSIMEDVESSVERYVQQMMKTVLQHFGVVKMTSYLGYIFSTVLNFQMSMWQLIMMEAIYLPTVMREQHHWERSTL